MKRTLRMATLAALLSLVSGCAAAPGGAPALPGTQWSLAAASRGALQAHGPESGVTLGFDGGRVSGYSGCNSYSGDYSQAAATLSIGALTRTKRGCMDAAGAVEAAWFEALEQNSLQVSQRSTRLTLTTSDGLVLEFEPGQPGAAKP